MSSMKLRNRFRKYPVSLVAAAVAFGMLSGSVGVASADIGTGGAGDSGHGSTDGSAGFGMYVYDTGSENPAQGWGDASINYFMNKTIKSGKFGDVRLVKDGSNRGESFMRSACQEALQEAIARGRASHPEATTHKARVIGTAYGVFKPTGKNYFLNYGERNPSVFYDGINSWATGGYAGLSGETKKGDWPQKIKAAFDLGVTRVSASSSRVSNVCVALNDYEPKDLGYSLTVSTDHRGPENLTANSTDPVSDVIHINSDAPDGVNETLNGEIQLHYDGPMGSKVAKKPLSITSRTGDVISPTFSPADFGWTMWAPTAGGRNDYWYDVIIPKQGRLKAAIDTQDRDPRESFGVSLVQPHKELQVNGRTLGADEVLAAGMFYDAVITGHSNGFNNNFSMTDSINTEKTFIGGRDADDLTKVKVTDPDGNVVPAEVTLSRENGHTVVNARVGKITKQGFYKLTVPTYTLPTKTNYEISDDSSATYPDPVGKLDGDSRETHKITPTPDKVWALNEAGALVAHDPDWTNEVGADNMIFMPSSPISATANDYIPAKLAKPFDSYSLTDDWSDGAKYLDFKANNSKVMFNGVDVTSRFTFTNNGSTTVATAGPEFLKLTAGLETPGEVKLIINGNFRSDYDTNGEVAEMKNKAYAKWNNETVATNTPSVFTWTPDPHKQVVGSNHQDGEHTYGDISGLNVWPGQKVEYDIQLDMNVPAKTLGLTEFGVTDTYDLNLVPDMGSLEVFDSRTNKPIKAKGNYTVTNDENTHSFTLQFTKEFISANSVVENGLASWADGATFALRFVGTVKDSAEAGSELENTAYQLINDARIKTETVKVRIPGFDPKKEDLNTKNEDIDGKTVVLGDVIRYRLTLDGSLPKDQLAYNVHKLGIVDDYDEQYLEVKPDAIHVTEMETGKDVTDANFNIQVKDGKLAVFAKQIDSVNNWGATLKGDPQPTDLFAYDSAQIKPNETPIINQDLMGKKYYVTVDAKVIKSTNDYVIKNQARQNLENVNRQTVIVSNPLKDIDPSKDVVVDESTKDDSINGSEIALNSVFNYRLNSSVIPANRAYGVSDWAVTDAFDAAHDAFTGVWAVYANTDIYNGSKLIFKKGDLLADNSGHESEDHAGLFDVNWDKDSNTIRISTTAKFHELVNSRNDLDQAWSAYVQMERIAPSEKVENKISETYNKVNRESNVVYTNTKEHPAIDIEKYTYSEGSKVGDRDTMDQALELSEYFKNIIKSNKLDVASTVEAPTVEGTVEPTAEVTVEPTAEGTVEPTAEGTVEPTAEVTVEPMSNANSLSELIKTLAEKSGVRIGFDIKNTGDVPLTNISLSDITAPGTSGTLNDLTVFVPLKVAKAAGIDGGLDSEYVLVTDPKELAKIQLGVGETLFASGYVDGIKPSEVHTDTATVVAKSIYSDSTVKDADPWNAKYAKTVTPEPSPEPTPDEGPNKGAVTGIGQSSSNWIIGIGGITLLLMATGTYVASRKRK